MRFSKNLFIVLLAMLMCISLVFAVGCDIKITDDDSSSTSSSDGDSTGSSDSGSSSAKETIVITSVSSNFDYETYSKNKEEKDNEHNEFYDKTSTLKVGDDNSFVVMPNVQFGKLKSGSSIPVPIPAVEWTYEISLTKINNDGNVKLDADEIENYVDEIDYINCTIDFSDGAIGSSFEVSVVPTGLTDEQKGKIDIYTAKMTIEVVDGYNVYNALDMSVICNDYGVHYANNSTWGWEAFKEEHNIDVNYAPSNVLLQTDVEITDADLPDGFFFKEGDEDLKSADADYARALNSLRDYAYLYYRVVQKNEDFCIDGNYFSIDCSAVSLVTRDENKVTAAETTFASHSALFYISASQDSLTDNTNSTVKNVNFIGNAPRVEDTTKTGGIILMKSNVIGTHVYNNISNKWFINYMPDDVKNGMLIEKCKGYDSFNSLIYVWKSVGVVIKDSEFIGAGGPAIIADHWKPTQDDGGVPSDITIIDSNIHSKVAGTEGWFNMYGATAIVTNSVIPLDQVFNAYGKTFVTKENNISKIDLIAIYKSSDMTGISSASSTGLEISGSLSFETSGVKSSAMDFGTFSKPWDNWQTTCNAVTKAYLTTLAPKGAPVFATSAGGIATYTGSTGGLESLGATGIVALDCTTADGLKMLQGDYLYMYYMGFGLCFGYSDYSSANN